MQIRIEDTLCPTQTPRSHRTRSGDSNTPMAKRAKEVSGPRRCSDLSLRYTRKTEDQKHVTDWIDAALSDEEGKAQVRMQRDLERWIADHSEQLRTFEIPHLPMPDNTEPDQAINTFVESNTSSLKLKKFDIAVAETLALRNDSLRSARQRTWDDVPGLKRYLDLPTVGDLILKVACLRSGVDPVESHYNREAVLRDVADSLESIIGGIRWVVQLLETDRIWDSPRLPSVVPFACFLPYTETCRRSRLDVGR